MLVLVPGEFNSDRLVETFDDADEGVRHSVARENFISISWLTVSNALTESTNTTHVSKLNSFRDCSASLRTKVASMQPFLFKSLCSWSLCSFNTD